jgi:hypothetical protein
MKSYMKGRHELCGIMLMAQRLGIEPGAVLRGALRVARAYQIDFGFPSGPATLTTFDLSTSGLSVVVTEPPATGTTLWMRLKVDSGADIVGRCQVVKIIPKQEGILMGVSFESLSADARDKLETVICDAIVTEIRSAQRPKRAAAH